MEKIVSVAMATYNGERFLVEQIESIVNQTRMVDEIIVCDDCSKDKTIDIVHQYEKLYPNIQWKIHTNERNLGFRKNFRRAISKCSGDVIFLCDQDDIWMHDKVEKMLSVFDKNPQIRGLISDFKTIDFEEKLLQPHKVLENILLSDRVVDSNYKIEKIKIYEALSHPQGQGCTMAITKEIAELYLKCELEWTHDNLVGLIAAFRGGLYYMKEQLIYYRLHGNNTIGMPIGEYGERHISYKKKIITCLAVWKYCFWGKTGIECRAEIFNKDGKLFECIENITGCADSECADLRKWRKFEGIRLKTIKEKKLVRYLLLRVFYREFFLLEAPFYTFEQHMIRLVTDIGAIVK